ncbi:hypothetical protein pEaSNUABM54_00183 [Erwinia phage pEa_SNUABM_54]|nr:hypothetical protein pEaSNUABM54_00183 [Erwinia phage pEa_SNUABM_54]
MDLRTLRNTIDALIESGVPDTTPVVVPMFDHNSGDVIMVPGEVLSLEVRDNEHHHYDNSPCCSVNYRTGTVVAINTLGNDEWQNWSNGTEREIELSNEDIEAGDERKLSAKRWDAFMSAPAFRVLGHAGLHERPEYPIYAHFGMEFWTMHGGRTRDHESSVDGRRVVTRYADVMIRNNELAKVMGVIEVVEGEVRYGTAEFRGEGVAMDVNKEMAETILSKPASLRSDTAKLLAREYGICTPVKLVIDVNKLKGKKNESN